MDLPTHIIPEHRIGAPEISHLGNSEILQMADVPAGFMWYTESGWQSKHPIMEWWREGRRASYGHRLGRATSG